VGARSGVTRAAANAATCARGRWSSDPRGESRTGPTRRDVRAQGKSRRKQRGFPRADLRAGGPGFRALLSHARNPWPAAAKRPDARRMEIRADAGERFPRPAGGGPVRDSLRGSGDDWAVPASLL